MAQREHGAFLLFSVPSLPIAFAACLRRIARRRLTVALIAPVLAVTMMSSHYKCRDNATDPSYTDNAPSNFESMKCRVHSSPN
jgi:hypothetical protein